MLPLPAGKEATLGVDAPPYVRHGFLRVRCDSCHAEHLVAFSCKKHGFCPSCGARRMAESAALLVDEVLMKTGIGREFVAIYYRFSPPVARKIGETDTLRSIVRFGLYPVILLIEHIYFALLLSGSMILVAFTWARRTRPTR